MDDLLPPALILDILSRLSDSADLARCRVVSKTLNTISREVRFINLRCCLSRYQKSRSPPETGAHITPFKTVFKDLVWSSQNHRVESVSIGVDKSLSSLSYDDVEGEFDDLYLTDVRFVKEWLPLVCEELKLLSISDFWIQSCWRRSEILALISSCCHGLQELEMKNAWLSVDSLNPMPMLTSLTLEFVRLDDENLDRFNHCFPCLQVLNLIGVGGLKEPKIHLLHLKTCRWTVSNAPISLTIIAPVAVELELKCSKPRCLDIETPLLSNLCLSLELAIGFQVMEFANLNSLQLESANLSSLIWSFPCGPTIKRLTLDSLKCGRPIEVPMLGLEQLSDSFPNLSSLILRSRAWSEIELCFFVGDFPGRIEMKGLREIVAQLVIRDIDVTLLFIFFILDKCTNLSDVAFLIHREVDHDVSRKLISQCRAYCPRIRWRWGMWKADEEDTWFSHAMRFAIVII